MNDFDQERFRRHAREKVQKLKNPNNSVSDRRVVMKYLEKDVTEEQIRDLAIDCLNTNKLPRNELTYVYLTLYSANSCLTVKENDQLATLSWSSRSPKPPRCLLSKWQKIWELFHRTPSWWNLPFRTVVS